MTKIKTNGFLNAMAQCMYQGVPEFIHFGYHQLLRGISRLITVGTANQYTVQSKAWNIHQLENRTRREFYNISHCGQLHLALLVLYYNQTWNRSLAPYNQIPMVQSSTLEVKALWKLFFQLPVRDFSIQSIYLSIVKASVFSSITSLIIFKFASPVFWREHTNGSSIRKQFSDNIL